MQINEGPEFEIGSDVRMLADSYETGRIVGRSYDKHWRYDIRGYDGSMFKRFGYDLELIPSDCPPEWTGGNA